MYFYLCNWCGDDDDVGWLENGIFYWAVSFEYLLDALKHDYLLFDENDQEYTLKEFVFDVINGVVHKNADDDDENNNDQENQNNNENQEG